MKIGSDEETALAAQIGRLEMRIKYRLSPLTKSEADSMDMDRKTLVKLHRMYRALISPHEWDLLTRNIANLMSENER